MKKKVAFINSGSFGITLLNYLKYVIDASPKNWEIKVFQTHLPLISIEESADYLKRKVILLKTIDQLNDFDIIFSNDAFIGRFLKNKITIFIDHGNAPLPCPDNSYYAGWTAFWDMIFLPSKSSIQLSGEGISFYRNARTKNLSYKPYGKELVKVDDCFDDKGIIKASKENFSSDLRTTYLCHIPPMRKIINHEENFIKKKNEILTIGILPTGTDGVHPDLSLYSYLDIIIPSILKNFTSVLIKFRPYAADLKHHNIKLVEGYLNQYQNVIFDDSECSSSKFFSSCDILITDASTGGISFLLDKCVPPIYWKPIDTKNYSDPTQKFYKMLEDKIIVVQDTKELTQCIKRIHNMPSRERLNIFKKYLKDELNLENSLGHFLGHIDDYVNIAKLNLPFIDKIGTFYSNNLEMGVKAS
ncbi:MAG: hypothetical protein ACJ0DD_02300 [Paracoccaceae bacterium]